jgi:N-acetylglucosaminyldiphosphoundecaprenol N-acetyl-beta-D-mannosaminyltransferase
MSPPYSSVLDMDRAILDEIKAADPDILLVALGNPKQEKWIGMYGRELGVPVMIGIGATLDFIAGHMQRAPQWMQNAGLEWMYRLLQEPRRMWKRYVVDMVGFNLFFLRQWWAMRRGQTVAPLLPTTTDLVMIGDTAVLNVKGRVDMGNHTELSKQVREIFATTPNVILNLEETEFLDSSAIGTLVALSKQAHDAGGELKLAGLSAPVKQTLSLLRLDKFFDIYEDVNVALGMSAPKTAVVQEPAPQAESQWRVVKMPRRLDSETVPDVRIICNPMLEEDPYLVVDLADTVFLASAGLALLADLDKLATDLGGELRVAGYSDDVYRVIEMVRFDKILTLYGDVHTAMA